MTLTAHERTLALNTTAADLLWLTIDDHWRNARQILADGEIQAAVIAAQRYDRTGSPSDGSTAWSDPTGDAAMREAGAEVRAGQVLAAWRHELEVIGRHVWYVASTVEHSCDESMPPRSPVSGLAGVVATVEERVRWLTVIPQRRLDHAVAVLDDAAVAEVDASIMEARDDAAALRGGVLHYNGRRVPGVGMVISEAAKALRAKPVEPPPKQPERQTCAICTPLGRDVLPSRGDRCDRCRDFLREHKGLRPTPKIARWWDDHPRLETPRRLVLDAMFDAASTRRAGRSARKRESA